MTTTKPRWAEVTVICEHGHEQTIVVAYALRTYPAQLRHVMQPGCRILYPG